MYHPRASRLCAALHAQLLVGMALRVDRSLATDRDSESCSRWLELPLGSLGRIPAVRGRPQTFSSGGSGVQTVNDLSTRPEGKAQIGCSEQVQEWPASHQGLANSSTGPHQRNEQTYCQEDARDRGRARQGGASSSQQGGKGRSERVEIRVDEEERPTPGEPSSEAGRPTRGPQGCGAPNVPQGVLRKVSMDRTGQSTVALITVTGQPKSLRRQQAQRPRWRDRVGEAVATARWEQLQALLAAVLLD